MFWLGFYGCDKQHEQKQLGKDLFCLKEHSPSSRETKAGTQVRNLEAETEAEAMKEHCLQATSQWLACSIRFFRQPGPPAQG